jgi:quinoprotein glucose dehydrogenase
MYGTTPEVKLFAIDAATGKELWKFVPEKHNQRFSTNRGVMYWRSGDDKRVLFSSGSNLYAINATDGKQYKLLVMVEKQICMKALLMVLIMK